MASTYSPSLRLELIGTGDQSGLWGDTTNTNLGSLIEQAITGVESIPMLDLDYTLSALNGSPDEARNAVIIMTSVVPLTAPRNLIIPADEKVYIVKNSTTGGQNLVVKTSSGAGVTVPNGKSCFIYCDGTNCFEAISTLSNVALTGVPTAPTAPDGTNTTQIATCAYVATNGIPIGGTGIGVRTGASTTALRSIAAGTGVSVTNGDGVAGNPTIANSGVLSANSQTGALTISSSAGITTTTGTGTIAFAPTSGYNGYGVRTISSSAPSGGSNGDIWYQV